MPNKGICSSCAFEPYCFFRKNKNKPIQQCEEFSTLALSSKGKRSKDKYCKSYS